MILRCFKPAALVLMLACASCKFPELPEIVDGSTDASDVDAFTLPVDAPPPLCDVTPCVVQISAGGAHTCARIDDGTVRCWGLNSFGQGGGGVANAPMDGGVDEYVLPRTYPTPNVVSGLPSANRATVIGAGGAYRSDGVSCAAMNDMQMWCWGIDKSQQLGRGGATRMGDISPAPARPVPAPVASISDVKDISVGVRNACAVFESGSVACWGSDIHGAVGVMPIGNTYGQPQTISIPEQVQRVVMRGQHALALTTSGQVWAWGDNGDGQGAVDPATATFVLPRQVSELVGSYVDVAAGRHFSCAVDATGKVWCWGQGSRGQLGRSATPPARDHQPALVAFPVAGTQIVQISGDEQHMLALTENGAVYEWGKLLAEIEPATVLYTPTQITLPEPATQVSAGFQHSCALLESGAVWCWGNNLDAGLGRGSASPPDVLDPGPVVF
ncbi:MAG: hypothetical protein K8M05_13105 [Deltaproteobacteria bacterium]|nr:hypothetical protein [Kofleriaceae bacterium]